MEWQLRVAAGRAAAADAGRSCDPRPRHRGAHLRRRSRARIPAVDRPARAPGDAARRAPTCASTPACAPGDEITPYYDPMIAKLIVHGATRARGDRAHARRAGAVRRSWASRTNVEFLGRLMSAPLVRGRPARHRAHRARARAPVSTATRAVPSVAWNLAALAFVLAQRVAPDASPWSDQRWLAPRDRGTAPMEIPRGEMTSTWVFVPG